MTEPTDIESMLAEVEALDRDATPGPWVSTWDRPADEHSAVETRAPDVAPTERMVVGLLWYDGLNIACQEPDAQFIARSRTLLPALAQVAAERDRARINQEANAEMPTTLVDGVAEAWVRAAGHWLGSVLPGDRDPARAVLSYLASLGAVEAGDVLLEPLTRAIERAVGCDGEEASGTAGDIVSTLRFALAPILAARDARIAELTASLQKVTDERNAEAHERRMREKEWIKERNELEQRIAVLKGSAHELARAWDAAGDHDLPASGEHTIANVLTTLAKERESITEALDTAGVPRMQVTMHGEAIRTWLLVDRVKLLAEMADDAQSIT